MRVLALIAVLVVNSSSSAQTRIPAECGVWPSKAAWEWTDEERIERRLDERCLSARRAFAAQEGRRDGSVRFSRKGNDFVSGADTPELFFPWQLYDTLLRGVFIAEPKYATRQREIFEDRLDEEHIVLPDRFWERLEFASAHYLSMLRAQDSMFATLNAANDAATAVQRRMIMSDIEESQRPNCGARHSALAQVRAEFRDINFDRLLYIAVAPSLSVSGNSDRSMMSWVARGCPNPD